MVVMAATQMLRIGAMHCCISTRTPLENQKLSL
jgi:hypothetical protein